MSWASLAYGTVANAANTANTNPGIWINSSEDEWLATPVSPEAGKTYDAVYFMSNPSLNISSQ